MARSDLAADVPSTARAVCAAGLAGLLLTACARGDIGSPHVGARSRPPDILDAPPPPGPGVPTELGPVDPGSKVPHRLNAREYDRTLHDLLGVTVQPGRHFLQQEDLGFDTIAASFSITTAQVEAYLLAAEAAIDEVMATPALRDRVLVCAAPEEPACAQQIITAFGRRAWRRPLADAEVAGLLALAEEARALGEAPRDAIAHALRTMLVAPPFLYRLELDPQPESAAPRPLTGHELASRLSYFLWSTMPDETTLALAASGDLLDPAVLRSEVERMLASPKSRALVEGFSRQWLGAARLTSHEVLPEASAAWDLALEQAMLGESDRYFEAFLRGDHPLRDFLRAELHFVDARLAAHYGLPAPPGGGWDTITTPLPDRRGYLGLAGFLTASSFAHRTSPTLRAKQVMSTFLCYEPPPPPADAVVTDLDDAAPEAVANVRARLEQHRRDPQCAGCHAVMDPFGLSLEAFDLVGQRRDRYSNGDPIDTRGELPDGRRFAGLVEMSEVVSADPRFLACMTEKLVTYGLGRAPTAGDRRARQAIDADWQAPGKGHLADLIGAIVRSPSFTHRRGSLEGDRAATEENGR